VTLEFNLSPSLEAIGSVKEQEGDMGSPLVLFLSPEDHRRPPLTHQAWTRRLLLPRGRCNGSASSPRSHRAKPHRKPSSVAAGWPSSGEPPLWRRCVGPVHCPWSAGAPELHTWRSRAEIRSSIPLHFDWIWAIHPATNDLSLMKPMDHVSRVHGLGSRQRRPGSCLFL
jgi:hypothetical protein